MKYTHPILVSLLILNPLSTTIAARSHTKDPLRFVGGPVESVSIHENNDSRLFRREPGPCLSKDCIRRPVESNASGGRNRQQTRASSPAGSPRNPASSSMEGAQQSIEQAQVNPQRRGRSVNGATKPSGNQSPSDGASRGRSPVASSSSSRGAGDPGPSRITESPAQSRSQAPDQGTSRSLSQGRSQSPPQSARRSYDSDSSLGSWRPRTFDYDSSDLGHSRSTSSASSRDDPAVDPIRISAKMKGPGAMYAFKGEKEGQMRPELDTRIHIVKKGREKEKTWSHPANVNAYFESGKGGSYTVEAQGRNVWATPREGNRREFSTRQTARQRILPTSPDPDKVSKIQAAIRLGDEQSRASFLNRVPPAMEANSDHPPDPPAKVSVSAGGPAATYVTGANYRSVF
ncbi:MAG: hypothetical protein GOMPHAMPRED_001788 [Gomphillus americanus]|uniref:Uncharacterized protein n=1 Tax=Gomphillus americanus TaxID=1940652 RepID=A0A8H3IHZ1_9LECA|nr:MAG: hypothetical protein GOMPHAMPRED_001788 [Gomphillus americanus]